MSDSIRPSRPSRFRSLGICLGLAVVCVAASGAFRATMDGDSARKDVVGGGGWLAQSDDKAPAYPLLAECFDFEAWLAMDHDALATRVGRAIREHAQDPATLVMLMMYREAIEESNTPDVAGEAVRDVIHANGGDIAKALGPNSRALLEYLHEVAVRRGWWDEARAAEACWRGIQEWLVVGPFAPRQMGDQVDVPLGPELLCSIDRSMTGPFGAVGWERWVPETPVDIDLAPNEVSRVGGSGWFMLTQVENPGPKREVLLDVYAATGGMKVWLNDKLVMRRLQARDASRDDSVVVELPSGKSTILVKLGLESSITVRLCDPVNRIVIPGILAQVPTSKSMPAFVPSSEAIAPLAYPWTPTVQRLAWRLQELNDTASDEAQMISAALALVAADNRSLELAEDHWKGCEKWRLANPLIDAVLGTMYFDRTTVHSTDAEKRELRSRNQFLVDAGTHYARPRLDLAEILGEEDQPIAAAKLIGEAVAVRPHWSVHLKAAEFYERKRWDAEVRDHRMRAVADPKPTTTLLRKHAEWLQEDDRDGEAASMLDRVLETWPGSSTAIWRRILIAQRRGEFELAESLIIREATRVGGESPSVMTSRASHALAMGDWRKAKAVYDELAARPGMAARGYAVSAAELAHQYGTTEEAISAWESAHQLGAQWPNAIMAIATLRGEAYTALPDEMTIVDHALLESVKPEDYPKAGHAIVLHEEVWNIGINGRVETYGQKVTKILRQDSVDRVGRDWIPGTLIRARTMLPDGASIEPASVSGIGYEFPRVAVGTAIDTAWFQDSFGNDGASFARSDFRFRDYDPSIPTLRSRLVVYIPKGAKYSTQLRGLGTDAVTHTSTTLPDGRVRLEWDLAAPQSDVYEAMMPSPSDLVPTLTFVPVIPNDTLNKSARSVIDALPESQVTWLVTEKTRELLGDLYDELHSGGKMSDLDPSYSGRGKESIEWQALDAPSRLYSWINASIKGSGSGNHPHSTIVEAAGDREDLFVAMLEAAKIPYRIIRAGDDSRLTTANGLIPPSLHRRWVSVPTEFAKLRVNNRVAIVFDGWTLVDLSYRMAPFGSLGRNVSNAIGVEIDPDSLTWKPFRAANNDGVSHGLSLEARIELSDEVDEDSVVSGRLSLLGDAGWQQREDAATTTKSRLRLVLESDLSNILPSVTVSDSSVEGENLAGLSSDNEFSQGFSGELSGLVEATEGQGWEVNFPIERTSMWFLSGVSLAQRKFDLMLTSTHDETATITLVVPEGFAWTDVPDAMAKEGGPLAYQLSFAVRGRELVISRTVSIRPWRVPANEYAGFKALIETIDALETRPLRLERVG